MKPVMHFHVPEYLMKGTSKDRAELVQKTLRLCKERFSNDYEVIISPLILTMEGAINLTITPETDIAELFLRLKEYARRPDEKPHYENFHRRYMDSSTFLAWSFDGDEKASPAKNLDECWRETITKVNKSESSFEDILYKCKLDDIDPNKIESIETVFGQLSITLKPEGGKS